MPILLGTGSVPGWARLKIVPVNVMADFWLRTTTNCAEIKTNSKRGGDADANAVLYESFVVMILTGR
jgi:hypothetical protein